MVNKHYPSAEYEALKRVVTADKRFRRFQYALTFILFLLVIAGGWNIQQTITHKIDGLVDGSVARGNARQKENVTIARETIRYNTCLIVVPQDKRTPENQEKCFKVADLPGGLTRGDFSPVIINSDGSVALANEAPVQQQKASQAYQQSSSDSSSNNPTPRTTLSTPNNVQPAPQRSTIQKVEDATAKAIDALWPFN